MPRVMDMVFESWPDIAASENHLKQLHAELLKFSEKDERHRGDYKKFPNHVDAFDPDAGQIGIVFETSSPFDTPREMAALFVWFDQARADATMHSAAAHGGLRRAFCGDPPPPRWQWAAFPGDDHLAVAASWLLLCAIFEPGEHRRSQQGAGLLGAPANAVLAQITGSRLGAMAGVLSTQRRPADPRCSRRRSPRKRTPWKR